ncbi:MAG: zinc ribbon domain-containing protein [Proteobacteria bacterium]|nr:zinc ribbon domain-containing protein [Pseudomonadota bacterium]MBU4295296.1 zinc ribbon domain-containing protein [Pseudomonadota bacterium]MCG2748149.1 zinc ribbon domain-containing protein [Desulfobulbaceae bacterium]
MPIYEFYCQHCHTIFNFLSRRVNTSAQPPCPKCQGTLQRKVSTFATIGKAKKGEEEDFIPDFDEAKMERVLAGIAQEANNVNEDDPRQMAQLMRKFSQQTGLSLGGGMEEAISRMEAGEDPDKIEAEMGELLENEDPFAAMRRKIRGGYKSPPAEDDSLYEL